MGAGLQHARKRFTTCKGQFQFREAIVSGGARACPMDPEALIRSRGEGLGSGDVDAKTAGPLRENALVLRVLTD